MAPELSAVLAEQDALVKKPGLHALPSFVASLMTERQVSCVVWVPLGYFTHSWWPRKAQHVQRSEGALVPGEGEPNHSDQNQRLKNVRSYPEGQFSCEIVTNSQQGTAMGKRGSFQRNDLSFPSLSFPSLGYFMTFVMRKTWHTIRGNFN